MSSRLIDPVLRSPEIRSDAQESDSHDMVAVRAWARSRGYPIDESGAVPLVVLRTYARVQGG